MLLLAKFVTNHYVSVASTLKKKLGIFADLFVFGSDYSNEEIFEFFLHRSKDINGRQRAL